MIGFDWSNPETFWLNVTNLGLGLFVALGLGAVIIGACRDLLRLVRGQN